METAVGNPDFSILVEALVAADLVDALNEPGPFTVFAPTDEAFAALPEGTVESLLAEEGLTTLKLILTYHVLSGRVYADDALASGRAHTLGGEPVTVGITDGQLRVNESAIVNADLEAANGVVHVIDRVLLPPQVQAAQASSTGETMTAESAPSRSATAPIPSMRSSPSFSRATITCPSLPESMPMPPIPSAAWRWPLALLWPASVVHERGRTRL